ncbi:MAG: DUF4340 domain-containing protein [Anaerolineae bacterium]
MSRLNQILAATLVVQIILVGAIFLWPRPAASSASGPLLPNYKAADVTGLTLTNGEGKRLALAKNGESWVLSEAGDYPVDSTKVTPFLEKLEKVKSNRLVAKTEASHAQLKVATDSYESLVELKLKDGTTHKLYLGSSAGASATHVRSDDQPEVYLSGDINSFDANANASAWIDTLYFTVPQTATVGITLENANGTFEFVKEGEKWTMKGLAAGETFNENNFFPFMNQAIGLRMTEPLGKENSWFGSNRPQATVTVLTQEGSQTKSYTLEIGDKDAKDNSYVVKASNSPYYVRLAEFTAKTFVDKKREDFLQAPPTAEPGAVGTPTP